MSYAIVARRPVSWPRPLAALSQSPQTECTGGERMVGSPDYCCPDRLWTEATYRQIKGDSTWRYHIEQMVRRALATYFEPSGLEKTAYDMPAVSGAPAQVTVPTALRNRCALAIRNFNDAFQTDRRWVKNTRGLATPCTADGYYSTWGEFATGMDKPLQAAAFKRMLGSGYSEAEVGAFLASAWQVFGTVPRLTTFYPLGALPPPEWGDGAWYHQPVMGMLYFFGWSASGQLTPSAFSAALLNLLAPGLQPFARAAAVARKATAQPRPIALVRASLAVRRREDAAPNVAAWSTGQKVAAGTAGVALAALLLYLVVL